MQHHDRRPDADAPVMHAPPTHIDEATLYGLHKNIASRVNVMMV
jgi:hypothetical protein